MVTMLKVEKLFNISSEFPAESLADIVLDLKLKKVQCFQGPTAPLGIPISHLS